MVMQTIASEDYGHDTERAIFQRFEVTIFILKSDVIASLRPDSKVWPFSAALLLL